MQGRLRSCAPQATRATNASRGDVALYPCPAGHCVTEGFAFLLARQCGAQSVNHDFGTGRHPGEMLFVTDPERSSEEDGGWLLGLVHDDALDRTSLVVLDAQRVGDAPIAQINVPRRIPYGFHGTWVTDTGARR